MSFATGWHRRVFWHHPDLHARLRRTQAPTDFPLALQEIVAHLRLDPTSDQGPEAALLTGMRDAAVGALERYCSNAIMPQGWTLTLHAFPPSYSGLELPIPPFATLTSITVNGDDLDLADFVVEPDDRLPATLYAVTNVWPSAQRGPLAIAIVFQCGYANTDKVPPDIKQALLMAIATWYENRESLQQFTLTPMIEIGWQALLAPYRQVGFA